jgi:hypothetical protein
LRLETLLFSAAPALLLVFPPLSSLVLAIPWTLTFVLPSAPTRPTLVFTTRKSHLTSVDKHLANKT